MKIKQGFMLREIADQYIVVPVGKASIDFNGIVTLNEVGAFLWKAMNQAQTVEGLVHLLRANYLVDENIAFEDVKEFIQILQKASLLEE